MSVKLRAVADDSKNIFTFEFSIKNVSAFTQGQILYSPEYTVNNLSWKLSVNRNSNDEMSVYLNSAPCSSDSILWSCFASVRLTLVSSESSLSKDSSVEYKRLFTAKTKGWGSAYFMDWNSVIDPTNGYMNNDAIKFRVHIEADTPKNTTSNLNVDKPSSTTDWLCLFENSLNERIVLRIADEFKRLDATNGEVQSSVNNLKVDFKKTVDPIVDSVRKEVTSLEEKLVKNNPDFKLLTTPILDKLILLEAKIEESGKNYVTAVENLQYSISKGTENQIRGISELENIKNTIEKGISNEEALEKIVGAAVEPVAAGISTEIQMLAKKLEEMDVQGLEMKLERLSAEMQAVGEKMEKSFLEHVTKVVTEFQNVNLNRNDATDDDLSNEKTIFESELSSNGKNPITKEADVVKEETVPVSALKLMKELLVEPPQRMLCNHIPNSLMSGTDHEGKVFQPYQPMMSQREFRLFQPGDLATSKRKRVVDNNYCGIFGPKERVVDNNYCGIFGPKEPTTKSPTLLEQLSDSSKEELMFLGKTEDGEWKAHKVSDPQQLEELSKEYKSFKIYDLENK